jgi:hypothetical protein
MAVSLEIGEALGPTLPVLVGHVSADALGAFAVHG